MTISRLTLGLATLLILPLTACGGSVKVGNDTPTVSAADVAAQVKSKLTETVGTEPDQVECPEDLKDEVGASIRCILTNDGEQIGVTVTTTKVEGTNVSFDIQVDDQVMSPSASPS